MSNYLDRLRHRPILSLLILSAAARIFTLSLLYTAKQIIPTLQNERQPQFTNSTSRLEAFVRWDTLYFIDIALDGYATDKVTAFMPGLPLLMRYAGNVIMTMRGGQELLIEDTVIAGILLAFLAGVSATLVLYK
jgi:phosphatidylinositol glycan class V